jgi:hypothetical protein
MLTYSWWESYEVRMHEPGARVSSADAEGLARV